MIRINLMPRAEARRQAARARERQIAVSIAVVLALVILIAELTTRRQLGEAEQTTALYQSQLAELERRHHEAQRLERRRDELRAKLRTIAILERQRTGPVRVLDDLSGSTPEKLWLTEMRESGGTATLVGRGLDNQTIAAFMRRLEQSPYFDQVDLVETKQVEAGQAKLKEFSIRARVVYAGLEEEGVDKPAEQAGTDDEGGGGPSSRRAAGPLGNLARARHAAEAAEARDRARDEAAHGLREPRS